MPKFPLTWNEEFDNKDRLMFEAASPYHDDGSPFYFRIRQTAAGKWWMAHDEELLLPEERGRSFKTLREAQGRCQQMADEIVETGVSDGGDTNAHGALLGYRRTDS